MYTFIPFIDHSQVSKASHGEETKMSTCGTYKYHFHNRKLVLSIHSKRFISVKHVLLKSSLKVAKVAEKWFL